MRRIGSGHGAGGHRGGGWGQRLAGCRICIDSCPVDCLAIDPVTKHATMRHDECWYCLACELDCPRDAIRVSIPFLIR